MSSSVWRHRLLAIVIDLAIVLLAYYLMLAFRFAGAVPETMALGSYQLSLFLACALVVHLGCNAFFHVYSIVNRYVGLPQALWIVRATGIAVVILLVLDFVWPTGGGRLVPLSVVLFGGIGAGIVMIAVRFYSRFFQTLSLSPVKHGKRVLIVGAGAAAEMLVRQIDQTPSLGLNIVGLLDDNPRLRGMRIHHYPVLGTIADAVKLAEEHTVEEFFIAIPSADSTTMERIYEKLRFAHLPIKTLPPLAELVSGRVSVADVRTIQIEDVLGRPPVETDLAAIAGYLKDRRVMVTGAAGSIGSELSRQIASFDPELLILVDRNESGLYDLHEELRTRGFYDYVLVATHIQQRLKMRRVFQEHRPHVVFHAAAFKHVPLMEAYPSEAVVNNVLATFIIAQEAGMAGTECFVNISTDKAADPISAMGASKAVGELVVRDLGRDHPATRFCSVRFGNVLNSRGSVIPIFQKQIERGGPVTVTHKDMTRYFMSISEAVQLVLQAASMSEQAGADGGVFVLEMGEPVRILDLANKMITFAKNGGSSAIEIVFTGLRPGERLHELLVGSLEQAMPTGHPMIALIQPSKDDASTDRDDGRSFREMLESLIALGQSHADRAAVIDGLRELLPTYEPFVLEEAGSFGTGGNGQGPAASDQDAEREQEQRRGAVAAN